MFSDRFERERVFEQLRELSRCAEGADIGDPIIEFKKRISALEKSIGCDRRSACQECADLAELWDLLTLLSGPADLAEKLPEIERLARELEATWAGYDQQRIKGQARHAPNEAEYRKLLKYFDANNSDWRTYAEAARALSKKFALYQDRIAERLKQDRPKAYSHKPGRPKKGVSAG